MTLASAVRGLPLLLLLLLDLSAAIPAPAPAPARCGAWPAAGSSSLSDGSFPPPPADDRGFDVLSYDLDLRIDPGGLSIAGQVRVGLAALRHGLQEVRLDLVDDLTCTAVTAGGQELPFVHSGEALTIQLAAPLAQAQRETLTVAWQGRPPRHGEMLVGLLYRQHSAGTPDDPGDDVPIVANLSQPWSAHSWWPCKDHPADKALVSCAVTVPDTLKAVSNGVLLGQDDPEPGWRRYRWREAYPLATYLVGVAVSNYEMWQEDCAATGGGPLEFHVFPQDRPHAEVDFAPTCAMLEFLTGLVGPYPFAGEKYAQVEIKWTGAMEHTTATFVSQMLLTGDGRFETLVLHELAHHWFGDSLTPGAWSDIWLNEGFARYCEALWVEHAYGRQAYLDFMGSIGRPRHPDFFAEQGLLGDPDPILPNLLVYDKGAWLLHSLRLLLGDDGFFALLRDYAGDPALVQGTVRRQDLVAAAERQAGRPLAGFFTPWLETAAVPRLWWESRPGPDGVHLVFHQLQDPVFELAVPVRAETPAGSRERTFLLTGREQSFHWATGSPVTGVAVDPDSVVFMFRDQAPPPPLTVSGPRPNPAPAAGGEFDLFLMESSEVVVNVYDIRGRKLEKKNLGPLPATGPAGDDSSQPHRWRWRPDLLSPPPPSGVYWLEFRAGTARAVRKITLLR